MINLKNSSQLKSIQIFAHLKQMIQVYQAQLVVRYVVFLLHWYVPTVNASASIQILRPKYLGGINKEIASHLILILQ